MRIIFLDIDGVLNTYWFTDEGITLNRGVEDKKLYNTQAIRYLDLICKESDFKIVISSTWRKLYKLEQIKTFLYNSDFKVFVDRLIANRDIVGNYNNYAAINTCFGMALEKQKAMEHPYPATTWKIEKFGYDGKQLHHIIRLYEFATRFFLNEEPYEDCLLTKQRERLIAIKKNELSLNEARKLSRKTITDFQNLKESYMSNELRVGDYSKIDEIIVEVIKHYFREELL